MLTVYWICLLGGLAFSVLALVMGDLLEGVVDAIDALDGFLDPLSLVGGIATFGGAGILFERLSNLGSTSVLVLSIASGILLGVGMHFLYVRPMKESESSTGFSMQEYRGKIGEVLTTIPARGYGEVLISIGLSNTFREAASFHGVEISSGTRIVVVDIVDGDLLVAPFEDEIVLEAGPETPAIPQTLPHTA